MVAEEYPVANRDGYDEIFVMNADGTGVTQLTDNDDWDVGPGLGSSRSR